MVNKILFNSICALFLSLCTFFSLSLFKKTKIYTETLIIQQQIDEENIIDDEIYLLNQNKINLSEVKYFTINYPYGPRNYDTSHIQYYHSLLRLINITLENLQSFSTTVTIFGKDESLLNYLFSSLE